VYDPDLDARAALDPHRAATARDRDEIEVSLRVRDPELVAELRAIRDPRERDEHAQLALRIGLLALRSARGQIDAGAVRGEVDRLLIELRKGLEQHRDHVQSELSGALKHYFDPNDGRFEERVRALVKDDGELAQVIRAQVHGSDSALARTLAQHVGAESPLLRSLDPTNSAGLVAGVQRLVEDALGLQRTAILGEFSLDNREGALARFLGELTRSHGEVGEALQERIGAVVREFSLDDENSGLSRLVRRVERAQQQIADEFTLDSETSALARMRRELLGIAEKQNATLVEIESRMKVELAKFGAKREADARTTAHGNEFEATLLRWLERRANEGGDVCEETGGTTGSIKNCKVGDAVVELGPEHRAAGARIVFEAKEDASYRLATAREEMDTARKNRDADVGVFVLSAKSAPDGWETFRVIGPDVFVAWNAEDPATDVILEAALALARALCARARHGVESELDFEGFERAVRDVEKQIQALADITTFAGTIESGATKIREKVRIMKGHLEKAVETLDECREAARRDLSGATS
jgi:hypothetical protein